MNNDEIGKHLQNINWYEFWKLVRKHRPWLTTREAAAYLGIKPRTLESWRAQGKGPAAVQKGKLFHYHIRDLDAGITHNDAAEAQ